MNVIRIVKYAVGGLSLITLGSSLFYQTVIGTGLIVLSVGLTTLIAMLPEFEIKKKDAAPMPIPPQANPVPQQQYVQQPIPQPVQQPLPVVVQQPPQPQDVGEYPREEPNPMPEIEQPRPVPQQPITGIVCKWCGKQFKTDHQVRLHILSQHPDKCKFV